AQHALRGVLTHASSAAARVDDRHAVIHRVGEASEAKRRAPEVWAVEERAIARAAAPPDIRDDPRRSGQHAIRPRGSIGQRWDAAGETAGLVPAHRRRYRAWYRDEELR